MEDIHTTQAEALRRLAEAHGLTLAEGYHLVADGDGTVVFGGSLHEVKGYLTGLRDGRAQAPQAAGPQVRPAVDEGA